MNCSRSGYYVYVAWGWYSASPVYFCLPFTTGLVVGIFPWERGMACTNILHVMVGDFVGWYVTYLITC